MRARILAGLILILLVVVPAWLYYHFTVRQVASIEIRVSSGSVFSVDMIGSFGIDGLPLADRALVYHQDCISSCMITPVLPARYNISITSSGQITLYDTVSINTADRVSREYVFQKDISLTPVTGAYQSLISSGSIWHVRTSSGSFVLQWEDLIEDIRFTDAIDLDHDTRLGYIDATDSKKLSLGNFPLGQSVLIRLNRITGESVVLRKGIDVRVFIQYDQHPAYMDSIGNIFLIQ
jgi:hypothetical protein